MKKLLTLDHVSKLLSLVKNYVDKCIADYDSKRKWRYID